MSFQKLSCFVVVVTRAALGLLAGYMLPFLFRLAGCRSFKWNGHTVIIFNRTVKKILGTEAEASYTSVGRGWFHFRSMRAFKKVRVRRHEWAHREQHYRDWLFPFKYLWFEARQGYSRTPYEIKARFAESIPSAGDKT